MASMERAEHVLAGHAGLAAILGADRARVMQSLLNLNDDLNRRANAVAKRLKVPVTTAVEELLVDVPPADLVKLKGWRRVAHKVQQWLAHSLMTLRRWKAQQLALCERLGWQVVPGHRANYFVASLPLAELAAQHHAHTAPKPRASRLLESDIQSTQPSCAESGGQGR